MFWDNFIYYCNLHNVKPNTVTKAIGMSNAAATDWKNGSQPRDTALHKIADYFGVSVEELTKDTNTSETKVTTVIAFTLTPHETEVMKAYRSQPEMQPAVDKLLGVTEDGVITLSQAAKSSANRKPGYEQKAVAQWEAIENAPETDDDLL